MRIGYRQWLVNSKSQSPTGGPLKPGFGLSGEVRLPETIFPLLALVFLQPIRIQFPLGLRNRLRIGGSCSIPSLPHERTAAFHWIPVDIAKLFNKLLLVADV
jgi:hypothetical protein